MIEKVMWENFISILRWNVHSQPIAHKLEQIGFICGANERPMNSHERNLHLKVTFESFNSKYGGKLSSG